MTKKIRLADYVAQTVAAQGTHAFFMLSGGMMMHLMDAFGRIPDMRYFCNHHEQASAMGAEAYARESGKLGLCLATSGPGATNILTGLVGAYQDSVPVLFLTGQCKRKETVRGRGIPGLRQCGFLEVDIVPIVESVTKYAVFLDDPASVRFHLEKAIHLAISGRPGPVLIDVPLDVQGALIEPEELQGFVPEKDAEPIDFGDIEKVLDAVHGAKRPVIIAGHGIQSAGMAAPFRELAETWQIPVATTLMAKDLLPYKHPQFVGHPGPRANRGANFVVQAADVILFMGSSVHIQTVGYEGDLFAPNALKIQIDLDKAVLAKEHIGSQWKFSWDIREYIPLLRSKISELGAHSNKSWTRTAREWGDTYSSRNEPHDFGAAADRVNIYEFIERLSAKLTGKETILTDAGQPHPILGQAFQLKEGQRYLNPGSFAGMGWALPAAIGAAAAAPEKTVISIFGDGSLQTNIHELQTLVHYQPNVKLFVINNDGYASIRNTQKNFFAGFYVGSTGESGVTLPDSKKICAAYGLAYVGCASRAELDAAITAALSTNGPVLCEIFAQTDQKILPAVGTKMLENGAMRSGSLHEMSPDIDSFGKNIQGDFKSMLS